MCIRAGLCAVDLFYLVIVTWFLPSTTLWMEKRAGGQWSTVRRSHVIYSIGLALEHKHPSHSQTTAPHEAAHGS